MSKKKSERDEEKKSKEEKYLKKKGILPSQDILDSLATSSKEVEVFKKKLDELFTEQLQSLEELSREEITRYSEEIKQSSKMIEYLRQKREEFDHDFDRIGAKDYNEVILMSFYSKELDRAKFVIYELLILSLFIGLFLTYMIVVGVSTIFLISSTVLFCFITIYSVIRNEYALVKLLKMRLKKYQ